MRDKYLSDINQVGNIMLLAFRTAAKDFCIFPYYLSGSVDRLFLHYHASFLGRDHIKHYLEVFKIKSVNTFNGACSL